MDDVIKPIIISVVTGLVSGGVAAIGAVAAMKVEIRWLKTLLMSRPCMDRRTEKEC